MTKEIRIGALISGGGTNLQAIIDGCEAGKISGRMVFVGTDNPEAGGLARASRHKIPQFVVDYARFLKKEDLFPPEDFDVPEILAKQSLFPPGTPVEKMVAFLKRRAVAEAALLEKMRPFDFDLLVLAGFMRVLTPYFIDRVNTDPTLPRIMNIHPAILPAFPGTDGYGDTVRYGSKVAGCTVHFVDYGEDSGPIIGQRAFPIVPGDTLDDVKRKGLEEEWKLYPQCIDWFAKGQLRIRKPRDGEKGRTIVEISPLVGTP